MSESFLLKEYELCYEQLRFYDTRFSDLLKYLFTLTSSVATAQFAIYKLLKQTNQEQYVFHSILSAIVFIASLLVYLSMLQNRLYFVYIAKQINAIREHYLGNEEKDFKNNQLYVSTDFPALKIMSIHTFYIIGVSVLSSIFAASTVYALLLTMNRQPALKHTVTIFLAVVVVEVIFGISYLITAGNKKADNAIHGKAKES